MSKTARIELHRSEVLTRQKLLDEFRLLQIRLKDRFQKLLTEIQEQRNKTGSVPVSFIYERARLATLLVDVAQEITRLAGKAGSIIKKAQANAVDIATADVEQLIKTQTNQNQIVRFDPEAAKALIGNTAGNAPLKTLLSNLTAPVVELVKNALLDGIATGAGAGEIARNFNTALGTGAARSLTIARTETNAAYRQAAVSHFKANKDLVKGYIWLSALDLRTCLICWSRHGKTYSLNRKPATHPNCRCTMLAHISEIQSQVETGAEKFKTLTEQQQLAILGAKRFELYERGLQLADFVGEKRTPYGKSPYLKPLADLPEPKGKKKVQPVVSKPIKAADLKPQTPAPAASRSGKPKTSSEALAMMKKVAENQSQRIDQITEKLTLMFEQSSKGIPGALDGYADLISERGKLIDEKRKLVLDVLRLDNPTSINPIIDKKFKGEQRKNLEQAINDFNSLVSDRFLNKTDVPFVGMKARRAFHRNGSIHLPSAAVKKNTVIHEISHALEQQGSGVLENTLEFLEYRTKGEKSVKLQKLFPGYGYGRHETTQPDKFFDPYVGKTYKNFDGTIRATEVVSMGVERYYSEPLEFAEDDPEYFDFIFKLVRGEKWLKPK